MISQRFLGCCPVPADLQDDDWARVVYEIAMDYSLESLRAGREAEERRTAKPSADTLREAGYTEDDIAAMGAIE